MSGSNHGSEKHGKVGTSRQVCPYPGVFGGFLGELQPYLGGFSTPIFLEFLPRKIGEIPSHFDLRIFFRMGWFNQTTNQNKKGQTS